jgi:hypothetical protein
MLDAYRRPRVLSSTHVGISVPTTVGGSGEQRVSER